MKKPSSQRATLIVVVESILWIAAGLLARRQFDFAVAQGQVHEPWLTLLKFALVLALIAVAVTVHGLLFRWLVRIGLVPREKEEQG